MLVVENELLKDLRVSINERKRSVRQAIEVGVLVSRTGILDMPFQKEGMTYNRMAGCKCLLGSVYSEVRKVSCGEANPNSFSIGV